MSHTTTSRDLALITKKAMSYELFREATETYYYSLPVTNKHPYSDWNVLENTNKLMRLQEDFYGIEYLYDIKGVKTGTTTAAGSNLITTAHGKNGLELICVLNGVRNDNSKYLWSYTVALLESAAQIQSNVTTLIQEGVEASADTGKGEVVTVIPDESFAYYDPDTSAVLDLSVRVSDNKDVIEVVNGEEVIFSTSCSEIISQDSIVSDITSSINSSDDTGIISSSDILIGVIIFVGLMIYTIIIWSIASGRKKKKSRNRIR